MSVTKEDLQKSYRLGRQNNNVLNVALLLQEGFNRQSILTIFQSLVERRLAILKKGNDSQSEVWCKLREETVAQKLQTVDSDTHKVYTAIEESGNKGIWTADIRRATNLTTQNLNKSIKLLDETKRLIKPVKNIHLKNKKFYMLIDLEPNTEVTGGSFYIDGEFNDALVNRIRGNIQHCLSTGRSMSLEEIVQYVKSAGFGTDLSDQDIAAVVTTLELEQEVGKSIQGATGVCVYSAVRWTPAVHSVMEVPCGGCPIFSVCFQGSTRVSPETCKYYNDWL